MPLRITNPRWDRTPGPGRAQVPCLRMEVEGVPTYVDALPDTQRWWFRGYGLVHLPGLEEVLPVIVFPGDAYHPGPIDIRGHTADPDVCWYAADFFSAVRQGTFRAGPPFSHPPAYASA